MVVDVIFLKNSTSVVIEINPHLFPTVDSVPSEDGLAAGRDPYSSQCIGMNLVPFNETPTIVMLGREGGREGGEGGREEGREGIVACWLWNETMQMCSGGREG